MSDYTPLGVDKIAQQARRDASLIRCPRDGAVMRVTAWRVARAAAPEPELCVFTRLPPRGDWEVQAVDVECPACRRRAVQVALVGSAARERFAGSTTRSVDPTEVEPTTAVSARGLR